MAAGTGKGKNQKYADLLRVDYFSSVSELSTIGIWISDTGSFLDFNANKYQGEGEERIGK